MHNMADVSTIARTAYEAKVNLARDSPQPNRELYYLGAGFARNPISRRALAPVCGARTGASTLRLMGRNLLRNTLLLTFAEQRPQRERKRRVGLAFSVYLCGESCVWNPALASLSILRAQHVSDEFEGRNMCGRNMSGGS